MCIMLIIIILSLVSGEWVSGSVCMYIADYLCANYGIDPNVISKMFSE